MIQSPPPTIRLIAEMCDVSRSTVSLALKRHPRISKRVTDVVIKAATMVGYAPDPKLSQVMSHIARKEKAPRNRLGILLGAYFTRPDPWKAYPWFAKFYQEIAARADALGYGLDIFWLGEAGMTVRRMRQILLARGIEGLIVVDHLQAQAAIDFQFDDFATAVIGHGLIRTRLDVVGNNLHDDFSRALHMALDRGYQQIGLALDDTNSPESLHAWRSSYCYYESLMRNKRKIPVCVYDRKNLAALRTWHRSHRPDVIFGLSWSTYQDLQTLGLNLPGDVGFVALLHDDESKTVSGITLQYRAIATRAVDIVAEKLRRFEKGRPISPELILINGAWTEGTTLPSRIASMPAA